MAGLSIPLALLALATAGDGALAFISSAPGQRATRQPFKTARRPLASAGNDYALGDCGRRPRRRRRRQRTLHGGEEADGRSGGGRSPGPLRPLGLTPSSPSSLSESSPFRVEELVNPNAAEETPARSPPGIRVGVVRGADAHAFHGGGGGGGGGGRSGRGEGVANGKTAGKLDSAATTSATATAAAAAATAAATATATAITTSPAAQHGRGGILGDKTRGGELRRRGTGERSADPSAGTMISMRQLSVLVAMAALAAVAFDYEHGMAGFHWFHHWAGGVASAPHLPHGSAATSTTSTTSGSGGGGLREAVHLTPLKSITTGLGAGFTRAASRTMTFPLDTIKTRRQLSRLGTEDRAQLPEEMRRLIDGPASFKGVFKGFSAFLAQAGPSNAAFFLFYDALNALGAATILGAGGGVPPSGSLLPSAVHLGASSIATVPSNLLRTPAEVVKQRLQVGQESGNSLQALLSIVRAEGVGGLFVGGKEQLIREIPFNAVQFTVYECLKSSVGVGSELWADAALGAASSAIGALATQPVDTVKTRVMTKSVPGSFGGSSPGFLESASLVAEAEGFSSLYLGLLPRLVLVSTGGAFYFWGQEFAAQMMSRAGF